MRKLLTVLAVLVVAWLGLELLAPLLAESRIEERARAGSRGAATVEADVESFPMVGRVLATSRVRHVDVTLHEVAGQQVTFATVRFGMDGVELDRTELLQGEAEVTDVDRGTVTVALTAEALSAAAPAEVAVEDGQLVLGTGGARVVADLAVEGRELVVTAGGVGTFRVTLPEELPCTPDVRIAGDQVVFTCEFEQVPGILARRL